jgi:hypothetical protein
MKIGIMTFWWSEDNYGQILQCYALQKYLRDAGHDAYLIRYDPCNDTKTLLWIKIVKAFNPVKLINFLLLKIKIILLEKERKEYPRYFDDFRNKYIKYSEKIYNSYRELVHDQSDADVYIVGSDQVWNPDLLACKKTDLKIRSYFLDFGKSVTRKIAYAASFGKENVDDSFIQKITPLLNQFSYIGVREKSGLDICQRCGINDAEWVADPTMLLKADAYRVLYINEMVKKPEKPYCLLYMLSNKNGFQIKEVYDWAKKKNLQIVYISGNSQHDRYKKEYATIPQWLGLIDCADYVITNSFHCSVFSLKFQKRFGVVPLTGNVSGMNSRLISLFDLFNLEQRFINSDLSILDIPINWDNVHDCFENIYINCKLLDVVKGMSN